jgi:hypothetical protein
VLYCSIVVALLTLLNQGNLIHVTISSTWFSNHSTRRWLNSKLHVTWKRWSSLNSHQEALHPFLKCQSSENGNQNTCVLRNTLNANVVFLSQMSTWSQSWWWVLLNFHRMWKRFCLPSHSKHRTVGTGQIKYFCSTRTFTKILCLWGKQFNLLISTI